MMFHLVFHCTRKYHVYDNGVIIIDITCIDIIELEIKYHIATEDSDCCYNAWFYFFGKENISKNKKVKHGFFNSV